MQKILEFLNGKKTYITAALFAIFNFGQEVGWWAFDNQVWQIANYVLGALGLAFLRAGVTKAGV